MMMSMSIKLGIKRVVGFVFITWMLMCTNALNGQVINVCDYKHQADVNVYYTKFKHEADVVVMVVDYKWEAQYGMWWVDKGNTSLNQASIQPKLSIYECKYKHEADYIVYRTKWKHEVSVTWEFINSCR
jgi:hypothetical protein